MLEADVAQEVFDRLRHKGSFANSSAKMSPAKGSTPQISKRTTNGVSQGTEKKNVVKPAKQAESRPAKQVDSKAPKQLVTGNGKMAVKAATNGKRRLKEEYFDDDEEDDEVMPQRRKR